MKMLVGAATPPKDFDEWVKGWDPAGPYRFGQYLFNTAPEHIAAFCNGALYMDPYHVQRVQDPIINNFITFAYLCWDVEDPKEMQEARRLVMGEPGAMD